MAVGIAQFPGLSSHGGDVLGEALLRMMQTRLAASQAANTQAEARMNQARLPYVGSQQQSEIDQRNAASGLQNANAANVRAENPYIGRAKEASIQDQLAQAMIHRAQAQHDQAYANVAPQNAQQALQQNIIKTQFSPRTAEADIYQKTQGVGGELTQHTNMTINGLRLANQNTPAGQWINEHPQEAFDRISKGDYTTPDGQAINVDQNTLNHLQRANIASTTPENMNNSLKATQADKSLDVINKYMQPAIQSYGGNSLFGPKANYQALIDIKNIHSSDKDRSAKSFDNLVNLQVASMLATDRAAQVSAMQGGHHNIELQREYLKPFEGIIAAAHLPGITAEVQQAALKKYQQAIKEESFARKQVNATDINKAPKSVEMESVNNSDKVNVDVDGQIGHIHKSQFDNFKKKYPSAKMVK